MDPNATLEEIRQIIQRADNECAAGNDLQLADAHRLLDCVQALDEWISKGGFLPKAWNKENK